MFSRRRTPSVLYYKLRITYYFPSQLNECIKGMDILAQELRAFGSFSKVVRLSFMFLESIALVSPNKYKLFNSCSDLLFYVWFENYFYLELLAIYQTLIILAKAIFSIFIWWFWNVVVMGNE